MTADDCAIARKIYALLCSAHPHKGDDNLEKAVELALAVKGVGCAALMAQRAGEARRRAQLPRQRLLPTSLVERLLEVVHCFCGGATPPFSGGSRNA